MKQHTLTKDCWCEPVLFMTCEKGDIYIHRDPEHPKKLPDLTALQAAINALYEVDTEEE
jgi:hypothetical protein